jgi:penicillin-binding protein 1C
MEFIYPKPGVKIFIPRGVTGKKEQIVFQISHQNPSVKLYWHIDNQYIGSTQNVHRLVFIPKAGKHILTVVDENGNSKKTTFEVVE